MSTRREAHLAGVDGRNTLWQTWQPPPGRPVPTGRKPELNHRIGAEDRTLNGYEGLYHEIPNKPEQDAVLDDMCRWLSAQRPFLKRPWRRARAGSR